MLFPLTSRRTHILRGMMPKSTMLDSFRRDVAVESFYDFGGAIKSITCLSFRR